MKVTIRVDITTDWNETDTFEISEIERRYRELDQSKIGLSLAEGKDVLHRLQQIFVAVQAEEVCTIRRFCSHCHRRLELKDRRIRKVDTVFGMVRFRNARIISCPCEAFCQLEMPYSPMTECVPERAAGELIALEAKLSAQMPYRQAAATIREFLPVRSTLNHVTVRNRALRAGTRVEAVQPQMQASWDDDTESTLTIDGGFVWGRRKSECSSFEVLTGKLAAKGQMSRTFAFVRNRLPDIAERLSSFVEAATGSRNPRLCVITDGANGLQSIAQRLPFSSSSVLDWFHISMRVRYLEQIVKGMRVTTESEKAARHVLVSRIAKLRWCFWHGKPEQAMDRMQGILIICRVIIPETPGVAESLAQLDYRARELVEYVEANGGSTINYGARHCQRKPVSTATAESAVNQVINQRMCKRQQMRSSPQGVHLLAQVRCALINGDLVERLARYKRPEPPLSSEAAGFIKLFERTSNAIPLSF